MSSRTRFAALAALCLATFPGCQQSQQKLSKEVPALVNGAPITRAEVDRAAKALLSQNKIARPVIKMRQKLPPATARLDEARGQIALYLQQAKVRKSLAQYAAQLRAKARVERI